MPRMEKRLYEWFCKQRCKNLPVTSELLKTKAKLLYGELKEKEKFFASDGWLQNFKRRYGIRFLKISGEKLSTNPEMIEPFKQDLRSIIEKGNLVNEQIYNADETGLFWRLLPDKTLVKSDEKSAPGRKAEKARLTFLACTNATGAHKIRPLVIGKAKNPRCFKNFTLPVDYDYSAKAWMTSTIFENWFHRTFVPEVRRYLKQVGLPAKAILLLDNAPSHPPAENLRSNDGNIFAFYMPPNVTPLIQPMDKNVIRITKLYYRSSLLSSIVSSKSENLSKLLKELTIKDAVINLSRAWSRLQADTIRKCFVNILNFEGSKNEEYSEEDIPLSILKERYKSETKEPELEVVSLLKELDQQVVYSKDEIQRWNEDLEEEPQSDINDDDWESNEDQDEAHQEKTDVTSSEALDAFNTVIRWAERNIFEVNDLLVLRKCRDKVLQNNLAAKKVQKHITQYFSKM
ncbi:jerky protein homolog-like [Euwallacea similis]|uniref:jerky protein homolog-like n=1 Tax=Euwallacea similis TaxID=1736056 RepID=UPI0034507D3B